MNNKNINGLEETLFASLNAKFENQSPDEEEFCSSAQTMRKDLENTWPVSDEDFCNILSRIQQSFAVKIDKGTYIEDTEKPHQSWLPARRSELDFFFWLRYKRYLTIQKKWNSSLIAALHTVSDEILDLLGDPKSSYPFQRRGLVLGDVQSGKTANYTAICNKAADTGYRVIIILTGTTENLRMQTQARLDAEFSGRRSEEFFNSAKKGAVKFTGVGVGRYGSEKEKRIASFTSVLSDFDKRILNSNDLALNSVTDPVIFVIKKNKRILNNLYKWLTDNNITAGTDKIMLPLLLIDDEADNASVNTKDPDTDPAAINGCIRKLLKCFSQASYLGITATPFANIFIDPDSDDAMYGDDLFPRDFIYSLAAPTNYIGAEQLFGEEGRYKNTIEIIDSDEINDYFPPNHPKDMEVTQLPQSLYEALYYFILFNAVRDYRGDLTAHRSMLIHISRYTNVQNQIAAHINTWLRQVQDDIRNYSALPMEQSELNGNLLNLHNIWDKYAFENRSHTNWENICHNYLNKSSAPIDVKAVNQSTSASSLDYMQHKEDGLRVIAVGGNSLSRGLTLEGLGVSYFYRNTQMYDTLLQMGRWFGYRFNYDDICKIWLSREAEDWYGYISSAADELKLDIAKMKLENQTPKNFGLKVRQDPNSLLVTARNKMKYAKLVERPISVSGRLVESPRLYADKDILRNNKAAFLNFIDILASEGKYDASVKIPYWRCVPTHLISDLLRNFKTHHWHLSYQGQALADYIDDNLNSKGWDVVLVTEGDGASLPEKIRYGNSFLSVNSTAKRQVQVKNGCLNISGTKVRVGSGGCTKIGLNSQQIQEAKRLFIQEHGNKSVPDSAYLIKDRAPLLMLHIIETVLDKKNSEHEAETPKFIYALGVGFPNTGGESAKAIYRVNMVEYKNWIDLDEEDD